MEASTDTISQYFKGIQKLALVTREEMHELWKKAKKGDQTSKTRIMEANLRLVVPIAKKYHRQGIDFHHELRKRRARYLVAEAEVFAKATRAGQAPASVRQPEPWPAAS